MRFAIINFLLFPIFIAIPAIILYFIIKLAIKNAIKELKKRKYIIIEDAHH